jgi:tRNA-splicing ligase RtcB
MSKNLYSYHKDHKGAPLKLWDSHGSFEDGAMQQLKNIAQLPFIFKHIAGMPDVHLGKGATVGSVIATKGAIIPAAVGVDIGCGMVAVRTNLTSHDLPASLTNLRLELESKIPHGRTMDGKLGDKGAWSADLVPDQVNEIWKDLETSYNRITDKHPKARSFNNHLHLGTLGTGNHFIELCLDESDQMWVMLHSGSRGVGNKIGQYFIELAKQEMEKYFISQYLPDQDLSYLVEHTEHYDDYVKAVGWAQVYASFNRKVMLRIVLETLKQNFKDFHLTMKAINCQHNYVTQENHFNTEVLVTRKGAVRAGKGDLGIIPGSMGTGSFIVEGLGNRESFCSCSHGAGRVMSRTKAKELISMDDHVRAMTGVESRLTPDLIDESPAAYKPIMAVMEAQSDLVSILHHLKPILNIKG